MNIRTERINYSIRKVLANAINNELSDPRIASSVTITRVSVSPDLSRANIYVSLFLESYNQDDVLSALRSSSGRLRKTISNKLRIRKTPKLTFLVDSDMDEALKIDKLIDQVVNSKSLDTN